MKTLGLQKFRTIFLSVIIIISLICISGCTDSNSGQTVDNGGVVGLYADFDFDNSGKYIQIRKVGEGDIEVVGTPKVEGSQVTASFKNNGAETLTITGATVDGNPISFNVVVMAPGQVTDVSFTSSVKNPIIQITTAKGVVSATLVPTTVPTVVSTQTAMSTPTATSTVSSVSGGSISASTPEEAAEILLDAILRGDMNTIESIVYTKIDPWETEKARETIEIYQETISGYEVNGVIKSPYGGTYVETTILYKNGNESPLEIYVIQTEDGHWKPDGYQIIQV